MEMVKSPCKRNKTSQDIIADEQFDQSDKLSELPEFILHHIFSLLNLKQSCQLGSVSQKFHHLWSTNPVLDFDPFYFQSNPVLDFVGFVNFVESTMKRYSTQNLIIKTFKLKLTAKHLDYVYGEIIDKWVEIAVRNHVEVLDLCISRYKGIGFKNAIYYKLPLFVLSAKSLKSLQLSHMQFPSRSDVSTSGGVIKFGSLKCLSLMDVHLEDDSLLRYIISSCPLNELKIIDACSRIISDINITESSNIRRLRLSIGKDAVNLINLESSNLEYIHFNGGQRMFCPLRIPNPSKLLSLRDLYLTSTPINDEMMKNVFPGLPLLENLILYDCLDLKTCIISSSSLKMLLIWCCPTLEKLEIDAPKLLLFNLCVRLRDLKSYPILSLRKCPAYCKADVVEVSDGAIDTSYFVKLREFLIQSNIFHQLDLFLPINKVVFNVEDIVEMPPVQPYNLSRLQLHLSIPISSESTISNLIDGLFSSCHPKILSVSLMGLASHFGDPSLYKTMIMHKLSSCAISCKHTLYDVEVDSIDWFGYSDDDNAETEKLHNILETYLIW